MARDYLAVLVIMCIVEHSMSAHTDDPQRRTMKKLKFGALQMLCAGYLDSQISVGSEILNKYLGGFNFDENDFVE